MGALALLTSCSTVPREPAISLASAGQQVSTSAHASIAGLAATVDANAQLLLVENAISNQQVESMDDETNAALFKSSLRLSQLIQLRAQALAGLAAAYRALEDDARYDEPGAVAPAVDALARQATAFASLAGVGPASATMLATEIAKRAAVQGAAAAQKARLIAASRQINAANKLVTAAIDKEAALYAKVAASLGLDRANFIKALTAAKVLQPEDQDIVLRQFLKDQGLQPAASLPPAAVGYAVPTILGYRAWMASNAGENIYAAQIQALSDLQAQHVAFEAGQPVSLADINTALAQLSGWVTLFDDYRAQSAAEAAARVGEPK